MNNLLQLKGQFDHKKNGRGFAKLNLPVNGAVSLEHVQKLVNDLNDVLEYWKNNDLIDGALISVHYNSVVAKSNRIKTLFINKTTMDPNESIRGSKFEDDGKNINHVFTYYTSLEMVRESVRRLKETAKIIELQFGSQIDYEDIDSLNTSKNYNNINLSMSSFIGVVIDCYNIKSFNVELDCDNADSESIITIYRTKNKTKDIFEKLGIHLYDTGIIDETTVKLTPNQFKILKDKAPYLIAMQVKDLAEIDKYKFDFYESQQITIPKPTNEPVIGVIDTLFSDEVYFKDWVENVVVLDKDLPIDDEDYNHGTAVTSIIVDGPSFNPNLDDGCGRFRVKHFGVAKAGKFSSFSVLKAIRHAVEENKEIKVWNLSLGSALEIHKNFISPEAAELDKIQSENDVIFIIAGTNKPKDHFEKMRIGAPADSINSLVVNAVKKNRTPVSYERVGPVLSFFHKPDVSYYGGDDDEQIRVCTRLGEKLVSGTSFAAPWITRKMAYLIYNLGMTREVAKALIIDSAAGWERKDDLTHSIGYGVVPIKISDIVQTANDEIKFFMMGTTDEYETFTYNIPVPTHMDKHPFYARATLCYFPNCSRTQGVDYTNTEMDIHFGRIKDGKRGAEIKSINNNIQGMDGIGLYEGPARELYRKWDNIKHISDTIKNRPIAREKYGAGLWGLSIKTKERLRTKHDKAMQFGVVITLKEMYGTNRIDEFIKSCMVRGWMINQIDINARVDVYNKAEEDIDFE